MSETKFIYNEWISPYENQPIGKELLIDDGTEYHLGYITPFGGHINKKMEIITNVKNVMILFREEIKK